MPALDTNVLVRFLVGDDRRQFAAAKDYMDKISATEQALFVPVSVLVELEWVMRSRYGFDKPTMIDTLVRLLETKDIEFHEEASVECALYLYEENKSDFADCVHLATTLSHDRQPLVTFDRQASRLEGVQLLAG